MTLRSEIDSAKLAMKNGFTLDYHLRQTLLEIGARPRNCPIRLIAIGLDFDARRFRLLHPLRPIRCGWKYDYNEFLHDGIDLRIPCYLFLQIDPIDDSQLPEWMFIFYAPNPTMTGGDLSRAPNLTPYRLSHRSIRDAFRAPLEHSYVAECAAHLKLARIVDIVNTWRGRKYRRRHVSHTTFNNNHDNLDINSSATRRSNSLVVGGDRRHPLLLQRLPLPTIVETKESSFQSPPETLNWRSFSLF